MSSYTPKMTPPLEPYRGHEAKEERMKRRWLPRIRLNIQLKMPSAKQAAKTYLFTLLCVFGFVVVALLVYIPIGVWMESGWRAGLGVLGLYTFAGSIIWAASRFDLS